MDFNVLQTMQGKQYYCKVSDTNYVPVDLINTVITYDNKNSSIKTEYEVNIPQAHGVCIKTVDSLYWKNTHRSEDASSPMCRVLPNILGCIRSSLHPNSAHTYSNLVDLGCPSGSTEKCFRMRTFSMDGTRLISYEYLSKLKFDDEGNMFVDYVLDYKYAPYFESFSVDGKKNVTGVEKVTANTQDTVQLSEMLIAAQKFADEHDIVLLFDVDDPHKLLMGKKSVVTAKCESEYDAGEVFLPSDILPSVKMDIVDFNSSSDYNLAAKLVDTSELSEREIKEWNI